MAKVYTDKDLIEKFLTRGVDQIIPSKEKLRELLLSGRRIKAYGGFDPTGPHLHIGHAMSIRALRVLQQLGHEVTFLIGDFTSKVGDPDKDKGREILTDDQIQKNMQGWKEQAGLLIDFEGENPVHFRRNYEWLSKLKLEDLINLMSHTTVQQMIERDMFQKRLEENNPIGLHEFIYPLMQGFDSVAMETDLEIGGTDQIFNMMIGRSLVKTHLKKEKYVRAHHLMEAPDALTMSKTRGNGINLSDDPETIYGKAMSYSDEMISKGMRLLTDVPLEEIAVIEKKIHDGENPMVFKKQMAYEITKIIKGENGAKKGADHFQKVVQDKQILEEYSKVVGLKGKIPLIDFLKQGLEGKYSASHIKRVIEQGGVEVNGEKMAKPGQEIDFESGTTVKFGKREFFKVE